VTDGSQNADPDGPVVRHVVKAVRSGDRDAYARIVDLYQRRLFGLTYMMTRDAAGAEEVAQDTFVRAYNHLHAYDLHRPFYPWLAAIGVRLAQNWLVRRARLTSREGTALDPDRDPAAGEDDALSRMMTDERKRELWQAVASLPSGERTAVLLFYKQGLNVGEAAHAVGVADGTIKTLLFRARKRLRGVLGGAKIKDVV
jgi:RNA polymerase sigma-70 factor (ECF subfamily)